MALGDSDNIEVQAGRHFRLHWFVPDVPVTLVFANPDGTKTEFVHPEKSSPKPNDKVLVTLKLGPDAAHLEPAAFPKVVDAPSLRGSVFTENGVAQKELWARFLPERKRSVLEFTSVGGPNQKSTVQTVTIVKRRYDTIAEVLADPAALRRQAILASVFKYAPAFNTPSKKKIGTESGLGGHGVWVNSYDADGGGPSTCTLVNPSIMTRPEAKNSAPSGDWGFGAGKRDDTSPRIPGNVAWVVADKANIPSVGDTYILFNNMYSKFGSSNGHVGCVLHVPVGGTGLWITVDGGQGSDPDQFAMFSSRWGFMGNDLPDDQPPFKRAPNDGPYLAGHTPKDVDASKPMPNINESAYYTDTGADPKEIENRLRFYYNNDGYNPSSPRKMFGFVDVDDPRLTFDADSGGPNSDYLASGKALEDKIHNVIKATLEDNWVFAGHGT